jgi:hypothetical protein
MNLVDMRLLLEGNMNEQNTWNKWELYLLLSEPQFRILNGS